MAHNYDTYYNEVLSDAKEVMDDQGKFYDSYDEFYDDLWRDDSVTGNGSGSYYFNAAKAREAVSEFLWTDKCHDLLSDLCVDVARLMEEGPEAADVSVRCAMLERVSGELEEYWEETHGDED